MKRTKKILLTALGVLAIAAGTAGMASCGGGGTQGGGNSSNGSKGLEFSFRESFGGYFVSGIGTCTDTTVVIPTLYDGEPVVGIKDEAFKDCAQLTDFEIPDDLAIGFQAFQGTGYYNDESHWENSGLYLDGYLVEINRETITSTFTVKEGTRYVAFGVFQKCEVLEKVTLPDGIKEMLGCLFENCVNLTEVQLPKDLTKIGYNAFYGCAKLTEVQIPESVTEIEYSAFENCTSLTSLKLPDDIKKIGNYAFSGCTDLAEIDMPNGITGVGSHVFEETSYYNNESNWENGVLYMGSCLIKAADVSGEYTVKEGTTCIAGKAFKNHRSLTKVEFPDTLVGLGAYAFDGCVALESVNLPNGVTVIEDSTFYFCESLKSLTLPPRLVSIGDYAFALTALTELDLPESLTSIGDKAFMWTALTELDLPESLTYIGKEAFRICSLLTNVKIPKNVSHIGLGALSRCNALTEINVSEENKTYKSVDGNLYTKDGKTLLQYAIGKTETEFTIPNGVTRIEENAFALAGLERIEVPDGVTYIGDEAFDGAKFQYIVIPDSVTTLEYYALGADYWRIINDDDHSETKVYPKLYYKGTAEQWAAIDNHNSADWLRSDPLQATEPYFYSETKPTDTENKYWHYVDGVPTAW